MANEIELKIIIDAENKIATVMGDVEKKIGTLKNKVADLKPAFEAMAIAGGLAVGAVVAFGKSAIDSANEAAKVQAQLGAVIKSTGGVAGVTADAAIKLSAAMQKQTTYSDEAVLSAENLLLTFTKINKDVFPTATQLALDMSTALGQDAKSSAIQLGKALQDPILGVAALRRVGVNFSKGQQDVIKNLVETGRSAEAQQLIIKELTTEFGGSAVAATKTFGGQLTQLNNQLDDVKENIGNALIPVLNQLVEKVKPVLDRIFEWTSKNPELTTKIFMLVGGIGALTLTIGTLGLVVGPMIRTVQSFGAAISVLASIVKTDLVPLLMNPWVLAFAAATMAVYLLWTKSETFRKGVTDLCNTIKTNLQPALEQLWKALSDLWTVLNTNLGPALRELWNSLQPLMPVLSFLAKAIGVVLYAAIFSVAKLLEGIINTITLVVSAFKEVVNWIGKAISSIAKWNENKPTTIGGLLGNVIGLPGFADGGIVPGPIGSPTLAVVHGGERVLTAEETRNGGQTIIFNFNDVVAGDNGIKRIITQTIQQLNRQATLRSVAGQ